MLFYLKLKKINCNIDQNYISNKIKCVVHCYAILENVILPCHNILL